MAKKKAAVKNDAKTNKLPPDKTSIMVHNLMSVTGLPKLHCQETVHRMDDDEKQMLFGAKSDKGLNVDKVKKAWDSFNERFKAAVEENSKNS